VAHDAAQGDIAAGRGRAGLLAAAAARVIYTSSGAGVITLMVIGALLLVSPFVIARVERLSVNVRGLDAATDPGQQPPPDGRRGARPSRHLTYRTPVCPPAPFACYHAFRPEQIG